MAILKEWIIVRTKLFFLIIPLLTTLFAAFAEGLNEIKYVDMKNGVLLQYSTENTGKTYTVPEGCTIIGEHSFSNNKHIETVICSSTVRIIEDFAFSNCSNLTSIVFSNSTYYIGESAFSDCIHLEKCVFPLKLCFIGDNAFAWCTNLEEVYIPPSVQYIGGGAFANTNANIIVLHDSILFHSDSFDGATLIRHQ